jgi:hypothetical protein
VDAAPYLPAQLLQLFGMRQQALAGGRQAQALGLAAKQADTQLFFQLAQPGRHVGRHAVQAFCRTAERARTADGQKVPQQIGV